MARTDEPLKKLFKNKENFADLFNGALFHGNEIIKADKLTEINTENIHIQQSLSKNHEIDITKRYRDLCMQYDDGILQIILGCEDQSEIDYAMPVLSIVFYYGDTPWDASKSIHNMIKWPEKLDIKSLIPDYKINLVWAYNVEDIHHYKSDLQYILHMLEYKQDKEKLRDYVIKNDKELQAMSQDSHNAIVALFGDEMFKGIERSEKGEVKVVSKALLDIKNEGKEEGIKKGEILNLILLINKKYKKGKDLTTIADEVETAEFTIQPIYDLIKEHPDYDKEKIYELLNFD